MNYFDGYDFYCIPAKCPVWGCDEELPAQELLAHLLMHHPPEYSMVELGDEWPKRYKLDLFELNAGCNHVVGVIAYAGSGNGMHSRPVDEKLELMHHLPILLMMYVSPAEAKREKQYILYLVSPVASRRVRAHISLVSERYGGAEVRGLRCLRNYLDAPLNDSEELLHCNMDYLIYTEKDICSHRSINNMGMVQFNVMLLGEPDLFEVPE